MTKQADRSPTDSLEDTGERMLPVKAESEVFWEHIYRYRFATRFARGQHVLDIACGEGYGTAALQQAGAASVIGMDVEPKAVLHAASTYGIDARVGTAERIELASRSLDVIVSLETIEHLTQPESFLQECKRLLRPGGMLLASTPNREICYGKESATLDCPRNPFHHREYDQQEFRALIEQHFPRVTLYGQCPQEAAVTCPYQLATQQTWPRIWGTYRLRTYLRSAACPDLWKPLTPELRRAAVELIHRKDKTLAYLVNPYLVRRLVPRDRVAAKFLLATARV